MKRFFFLVSSFALFSIAALAAEPCGVPGTNNDFLGIKTIKLWPGDAPQAKGSTCDDVPTLTILEPQPGYANGSAVLVAPGGGYMGLAANLEGRQIADWFTARGFVAFILSYRLASHGYILPIPLLDARRAMQTIRGRAQDYHIDPNRIVMIGFSAGGHLSALASVEPDLGTADSDDPIARVSSRPNYVVLGYPWIGAITKDTSILSYCKSANVMDRCEALRKAYSPDLHVDKDTPPTFIFHTFNDETVPVDQALRYYDALVKAGVASELHVFAKGPHGTGLGKSDNALDKWPDLLEAWLRAQGLIPPLPPRAK